HVNSSAIGETSYVTGFHDHTVEIDPSTPIRGKGNLSAIRRPRRTGVGGGVACEVTRVSAIGIHHVNLATVSTNELISNLSTIRRPRRRIVIAGMVSEPPHVAPIGVHH